jgi:cardiolipin synthase
VFPQFIANSVTMLPMAILEFEIGGLVWPGKAAEAGEAAEVLKAVVTGWQWTALGDSVRQLLATLAGMGPGVLGPLAVGILVVGAAMAAASYPVTVVGVWAWRARWRSRRLLKGLPLSRQRAFVLPQAAGPALSRKQALSLYVGHPEQFQRAAEARLLVDGREAFPEMLAAIDSATETVDLETYILSDDRTGRRFQDALRRAAGRGVRVRLLYDYIGSLALPERYVRELVDAGVEAAVYHPPVLWRAFLGLYHRDHRKILVADRRVLFTGGTNICDENLPAEEGGGGWRDTHLRLDGETPAEAGARLFGRAWRKAIPYGQSATRAARLKARLRRIAGRIRAAAAETGRGFAAVDPPDGVAVNVIGNDEFRHRRRIRRAYLHAIRQATRYILIENAYFIPDRGIRRALAHAAKRGVAVAVAVAANSDIPLAAYASRGVFSELLAAGVRIFEWPTSMLHAKTAVIDDAWAIVGSYNFDRRSLLHNLEAVAVVADAAFAARLREQTLRDLAHCHEVSLLEHESRSWRYMLLESAAYALRRWL